MRRVLCCLTLIDFFTQEQTMSRRLTFALRTFSPLPALVAAALVFASTRDARASTGTAIAADLDYTHGINEHAVGSGTGFNVRLGYKLDLLVLQFTPEVGGAYHAFSGAADATLSQAIVGGRLAFGKILEPGVYAHLGYGHLGFVGGSHSGATADAGVTLDLTVLPLIDFGVHAGYNGMLKRNSNPAFDSFVLGIHAALIF
jgi:hypothetical protein